MNSRPNRLLFDGWLWQMAWRDARHHLGRFALLMLAIMIGTAALVSIQSLSDNLRTDIDTQSKTLLGADLQLSSRQPFSDSLQNIFDGLGGDQTREIGFASMIYFTRTNGTRLINVRAIGSGYPFYGTLETVPSQAANEFREQSGAIVDHGLLVQFGAEVGDTIQLGSAKFRISGRLMKAPGESAATSLVSPPVYIPMDLLESTGLLVRGSRVIYRTYFKFLPGTDVEAISKRLDPLSDRYQFRIETVESRKAALGRVFDDLYRYLNLVGFIALLLGCVGVASAVHVFVKQKWASIAVLRCVGASSNQAFMIFLIQIVVMTLVGSVTGALMGVAVQVFLPDVMKDFVPVTMAFSISWTAVAKGIGAALVMSLLFALLPLVAVRRISPLVTLRSSYEAPYRKWGDPLYVVLLLLVA
ncbi:MAG: ABC transporter permease, partial [Bacteroidetes bacterium]|nr:ABC transporter permease [Bacteroidota bacterium]